MKCTCGFHSQKENFIKLFIEGERIQGAYRSTLLEKKIELYMCPKCKTIKGEMTSCLY